MQADGAHRHTREAPDECLLQNHSNFQCLIDRTVKVERTIIALGEKLLRFTTKESCRQKQSREHQDHTHTP